MPAAPLVKTFLAPIIKPITRLFVGLVAIPLLRLLRKRIPKLNEWDEELEKDIEQWFRGSLILLVATANAETAITGWMRDFLEWRDIEAAHFDPSNWYITAARLLLAVACIEAMPDQELFSIIHPGPKFHYDRRQGLWKSLIVQWRSLLKGLICQHLNRASPVLAIMSVIVDGTAGWICYSLAITQYLIIGLVTSRDRALDVLSEFDREVARRRQELIEEFDISEHATPPSSEHLPSEN